MLAKDDSAIRRIPLVHPECLSAMKDGRSFQFSVHDLFQSMASKFHVVRAMNVLNPGYFGRKKLEEAIRSCASTLVLGGLLVIGRNEDEKDGHPRTTAFLRKEKGFDVLWDIHGGSEIKPLVLECCL